MKKPLPALLSILALLLLASCSHEDVPTPPARRTLIVWLAGDNNLSAETDDKLEAIAHGWDNLSADAATANNLIVYQDRQDQAPRLLQVFAGGRYNTLHTYHEDQNSCSPTVWSEVLHQAIAAAPAQDYGLLFFSHATGWLPAGNYPTPATTPSEAEDAAAASSSQTRTIGRDRDSEMELADFAATIPNGQFRFILFEACLMGGIEVAYELRHKADYLLVSPAEILSPGFTELYPQMIPLLFGAAQEDENRLANFARLYYDAYNAHTGYTRSATVSLLRTRALEPLATALTPLLTDPRPVSPAEVTYYDSTSPLLYSDLSHYLLLKAGGNEDDPRYTRARSALNEAIAYTATTPQVMGHPCPLPGGLTIYIARPELPGLNAAQAETEWGRRMQATPATLRMILNQYIAK